MTGPAPSIGGWCHLDSTYAAELVAAAGFDWCCVDTQHGAVRGDRLLGMLQAARSGGTTAYVRVPGNVAHLVGAALDAGADGVIVPQVSTPEQAKAAVAACRYPPGGRRSWGPLRARLAEARPEPAALDGRAACFVMVEDRDGLDNAGAIASVEGLSGILVGPADLALDLTGDPYRANDDATVAAAAAVAAACHERGIVPAVFCGGPGNVGRWRDAGFTMLAVDSDSGLLLAAARRCAADARRALSG